MRVRIDGSRCCDSGFICCAAVGRLLRGAVEIKVLIVEHGHERDEGHHAQQAEAVDGERLHAHSRRVLRALVAQVAAVVNEERAKRPEQYEAGKHRHEHQLNVRLFRDFRAFRIIPKIKISNNLS